MCFCRSDMGSDMSDGELPEQLFSDDEEASGSDAGMR